MGTMNVLVAIDPDTIQQKFGSTKNSSDSPVGVGSAHVTVMTSANGQTSIGVTDLSVEEEDEILWWVASPGGKYSCCIYSFVDAQTKKDISDSGIIQKPQTLGLASQTYIPSNSNPTQPTPQKVTDYCWYANVQATGQLSYGIQFIVFDNDGKPLVYCEYVGGLTAS